MIPTLPLFNSHTRSTIGDMEEISPAVAELFKAFVIAGALGFMAMIFSIIGAQIMDRLLED